MSKIFPVKLIFLSFWAVLFASRMFIMTGIVPSTTFWILFEIIYVIFCFYCYFFVAPVPMVSMEKKDRVTFFALVVILIHTVLFGLVLTNDLTNHLIFPFFMRQAILIAIVFASYFLVKKYGLIKEFLKVSYYVMSLVLLTQLVINIGELNLSNIASIFISAERTRASFGFVHYNTLGTICVVNIILGFIVKEYKRSRTENIIQWIFFAVALVMLLCSASRSSLISLFIYLAVMFLIGMERIVGDKTITKIVRMFLIIAIIVIVLILIGIIDFGDLLIEANRATLVNHAIPTWLESGRIWQGLGYLSNADYAFNLTPYRTYWLDNSFIFYLVTTGIIGFVMIMTVVLIFAIGLAKNAKNTFTKKVLALFISYMFFSFFEVTMFSSAPFNYILMVLFAMVLSGYKGEKNTTI